MTEKQKVDLRPSYPTVNGEPFDGLPVITARWPSDSRSLEGWVFAYMFAKRNGDDPAKAARNTLKMIRAGQEDEVKPFLWPLFEFLEVASCKGQCEHCEDTGYIHPIIRLHSEDDRGVEYSVGAMCNRCAEFQESVAARRKAYDKETQQLQDDIDSYNRNYLPPGEKPITMEDLDAEVDAELDAE